METKIIPASKQYITFQLGNEDYGINIQRVSIIEKAMAITRVPKTPAFIKGVVNLRGEIVPVMDLRMRFGMSEVETTEETRIIIVKVEDVTFGLIVDAVAEVLQLSEDDIESTSGLGDSANIDYLSGVGKVEDKIVILLNLERLAKINE